MTNLRQVPESETPPPSRGNSRIQDHAERLVRIERKLENMATKTDIESIRTQIESIKTLISDKESAQLKWLVGIVVLGVFSIVAAVIKTFLG